MDNLTDSATWEDVMHRIYIRQAIEDIEIARDVARKWIEARAQRSGDMNPAAISDSFDYPLIVNA